MADSRILALFGFGATRTGRMSGGQDDVQFNYDSSQGEEWLSGLVDRWPHPEGESEPPFRRLSIGALLADIAPLQPMVRVMSALPDVTVPDGMVVARRVHEPDADFVSGELDLPE